MAERYSGMTFEELVAGRNALETIAQKLSGEEAGDFAAKEAMLYGMEINLRLAGEELEEI